jgi:hypothetical protein
LAINGVGIGAIGSKACGKGRDDEQRPHIPILS